MTKEITILKSFYGSVSIVLQRQKYESMNKLILKVQINSITAIRVLVS